MASSFLWRNTQTSHINTHINTNTHHTHTQLQSMHIRTELHGLLPARITHKHTYTYKHASRTHNYKACIYVQNCTACFQHVVLFSGAVLRNSTSSRSSRNQKATACTTPVSITSQVCSVHNSDGRFGSRKLKNNTAPGVVTVCVYMCMCMCMYVYKINNTAPGVVTVCVCACVCACACMYIK